MRSLGVIRPVLAGRFILARNQRDDRPYVVCCSDVSLEKTTVCVTALDGAIVREEVVATEPEAIASCFMPDLPRIARVGLEAGPMSEWLVQGLAGLSFDVLLAETRQVRAALSAMVVKTDRNDARDDASPAHRLVPACPRQDDRRARTVHDALGKCHAGGVPEGHGEQCAYLLRGFGLRLPEALRRRWKPAVRALLEGHPSLVQILEPLLATREALREQLILIEKRVRDTAKADTVCRRLMSSPSVGVIVALIFRAAVDQPERFGSSKQVGACFGLTPRKYQSGETDRTGAIS